MEDKYKNTRIWKIREYILKILNEIGIDKTLNMNADFLDKNPGSYSINRIPVADSVFKDILGNKIKKDVYSFESRMRYGQDTIINLQNIGFFEMFEKVIDDNNRKGYLPEIEGIESIECLNTGTISIANDNSAEFSIQLQITYRF